jgi:hypothetical protein
VNRAPIEPPAAAGAAAEPTVESIDRGPAPLPPEPAVKPTVAPAAPSEDRDISRHRSFRRPRASAGHSGGRGKRIGGATPAAGRDGEAGESALPRIRKKQVTDDPLGGLFDR